jgi:hypothetical protein
MLNTAVAFFVFNRPALTDRVFSQIKKAAPRQLFIIADGPRSECPNDPMLCATVLEIINQVTWDCELHTLIRSENLGCRQSIPQGLDWVFTFTDRCIILEDDCLPDLSFFIYCENLLKHYENDLEVMTIGGCSPELTNQVHEASYYFSRYPNVWGWATWKRVWDQVEVNKNHWEFHRSTGWLKQLLPNEQHRNFWHHIFDQLNELDTWDYSLVYSCWLAGGLSIRPSQNLIKNIGFEQSATHTKDVSHFLSKLIAAKMAFPLNHPTNKIVDQTIEDRIEWLLYSGIDQRKLSLVKDAILKKRQ